MPNFSNDKNNATKLVSKISKFQINKIKNMAALISDNE